MKTKRIPLLLAGFYLLTALAFTSHASSLQISPVNIDMPASQRASSITVINTGTEAVNLQIRAFHWSQAGQQEALTPTNELMISPPAVTVPAGASYTLRVARLNNTPVDSELSYRLFIDELPEPIDPRTLSKGVAMVLRSSLPVFVANDKAIAQLNWQVVQGAQGLQVIAQNNGKRHAKISHLTLQDAQGKQISFGPGLNGYVLAGANKVFSLPGSSRQTLAAGSAVTLTANDGVMDVKETLNVQTH